MNDARTNPATKRRVRRGVDALVAQYIHELSDRHARARNGSPVLAGHPGAGSGAGHTAEARG